jgi:hypothetical protein
MKMKVVKATVLCCIYAVEYAIESILYKKILLFLGKYTKPF